MAGSMTGIVACGCSRRSAGSSTLFTSNVAEPSSRFQVHTSAGPSQPSVRAVTTRRVASSQPSGATDRPSNGVPAPATTALPSRSSNTQVSVMLLHSPLFQATADAVGPGVTCSSGMGVDDTSLRARSESDRRCSANESPRVLMR